MSILTKLSFGAAIVTIAVAGPAMPSFAQSGTTSPAQVAALSVGSEGVTLPEVLIRPLRKPTLSFAPYTTGITIRPSSLHTIGSEHFAVPAGYDADMAMHPYTSGLGPCPEGATGSGCHRPAGSLIAPSTYER